MGSSVRGLYALGGYALGHVVGSIVIGVILSKKNEKSHVFGAITSRRNHLIDMNNAYSAAFGGIIPGVIVGVIGYGIGYLVDAANGNLTPTANLEHSMLELQTQISYTAGFLKEHGMEKAYSVVDSVNQNLTEIIRYVEPAKEKVVRLLTNPLEQVRNSFNYVAETYAHARQSLQITVQNTLALAKI